MLFASRGLENPQHVAGVLLGDPLAHTQIAPSGSIWRLALKYSGRDPLPGVNGTLLLANTTTAVGLRRSLAAGAVNRHSS